MDHNIGHSIVSALFLSILGLCTKNKECALHILRLIECSEVAIKIKRTDRAQLLKITQPIGFGSVD